MIKGEGGSTIGYRASGVPGTLAGFDLAFQKHGSGKITWQQLVEPARRLAVNGYVLSHRLATLFIDYKEHLAKYPDSNRIFLNNGNYYKEGDLFRQPELAATLGRIQRHGAKEFYTGETARMIAADMKANNGLITLEDLKNYVAKEREPLRGTYRGHEIITSPPPSSGGIVMLEVLNMLEPYNVAAMGHNSSAALHLYTEASRRAFADRAEYMADPDFADVPVQTLIRKDYAAKRMAGFDNRKANASTAVRAGNVSSSEGMETTHFTVVDPAGNGRFEHVYDQRSLRLASYRQRNGRSAERRDGRFCRQARPAESLRPGPGRAEQGAGRQASLVVDDADHRAEKGRHAVVRGRCTRRAEDYLRRDPERDQRDRFRDEYPASHRRSAHPSPMAARRDDVREIRPLGGHDDGTELRSATSSSTSREISRRRRE